MTAMQFFVEALENLHVTCSTLAADPMPVASARSCSRRNQTWRLTSSLTLNSTCNAANVEQFSSAISTSRITRSAFTRWSSLLMKLMNSHPLSVARLTTQHRRLPRHHHQCFQQHLLLPHLNKVTSIRLHSIAS